MALAYLNRCIWRATSAGTGSFVVSAAITGYRTPALCVNPAVVNAATYRYFAESDDRSQWEIGYGVYTTADVTLTRATITDGTNGTSAVNFSSAPKVFMGGEISIDEFDGGTATVFRQTNAPTGWTKQTTYDNHAFRLVTGSISQGGSVNFSTLFGRTGTDSVTLSVANLAVHHHTYSLWSTWNMSGDGGQARPFTTGQYDTGDTGSGTSFTPAIDCRVKYVDMIIATKD